MKYRLESAQEKLDSAKILLDCGDFRIIKKDQAVEIVRTWHGMVSIHDTFSTGKRPAGHVNYRASHLPEAPHGSTSPLEVTGSPISCEST